MAYLYLFYFFLKDLNILFFLSSASSCSLVKDVVINCCVNGRWTSVCVWVDFVWEWHCLPVHSLFVQALMNFSRDMLSSISCNCMSSSSFCCSFFFQTSRVLILHSILNQSGLLLLIQMAWRTMVLKGGKHNGSCSAAKGRGIMALARLLKGGKQWLLHGC
jgi:hypothetical protein